MKRPLTEVISEEDFLPLVQEHSKNFLRIYAFLQTAQKPYTRRFYAHLIEQSEGMESFLDDHCARENKHWYLFGEYVACIRNISKVMFTLKHTTNRYPLYSLNAVSGTYMEEADRISDFMAEKVSALFRGLKEESSALGLRFPRGALTEEMFSEVFTKKRLPFSLDEEDNVSSITAIAKIATQYIEVVDQFDAFGWSNCKIKLEEIHRAVPDRVNEEKSRRLMATVHNLQSSYDHHIKNASIESRDQDLKIFRASISMPLHLLTVVNWLSHLLQRHIGINGNGKSEIQDILNQEKIQDIMINFALHYAGEYLKKGKKLAENILEKYVEVESCEIGLPEKLGMHLRPATLVAKLAMHHGTKLTLIVDDKEFDAGNILSITIASGLIAQKGYKTACFRGDKKVLSDLKTIAQYNYGEDEAGQQAPLPPELAFLRE